MEEVTRDVAGDEAARCEMRPLAASIWDCATWGGTTLSILHGKSVGGGLSPPGARRGTVAATLPREMGKYN